MKQGFLALAAVALCIAIPIQEVNKDRRMDHELEAQALIALGKAESSGQFKNFLPLVNHFVVLTSAVLPSIKASKDHKHNNEITDTILLQTVSDAAGFKSDLEQALPTGQAMVEAMVALGNVMGGSSGYNPVKMMSNVIGEKEMGDMIDELMKFPLRFPDPDERQLEAAEQVALTVGLGFGDQDSAIEHFMSTLSAEQNAMIASLQKNVIDKVMNAMMTPSGDPSPALIDEIKRQMKEMETKKGSTEMMPDEFKDIVRQTEDIKAQSLLAIYGATPQASQFKNFLPLVNQVVVYTGAVLPGIKANKAHKRNSELSAAFLVQSIAEAGGSSASSSLSEIEKYLPTSDDMLDAMLKVGKVMGGTNGFNPIQLMTNIVGSNEMKTVIDDLMHFPLRFPDLTDDQVTAGEQVVLSIGLGFGDQERSIDSFLNSLSEEQRRLITGVEKDVVQTLMGSIMQDNGEPTPKLIEEIKKEMREMEKKTGSTDGMPQELKDLVAVAPAPVQ